MLSVDEARSRIFIKFGRLGTEWLSLDQALGRVLAEDLIAMRDQPPLAVSAMDGYAVRSSDVTATGATLKRVGAIAAGSRTVRSMGPGETFRIFTGAPLPPGADSILIQENATDDGESVTALEGVHAGEFVRPQGLDFAKGSCGLSAPALLDARGLGLAAALGHARVPCIRRPRIAILATGDELRWPGETPADHEIIASNSVTLAGLVRGWGGDPVDLGIARDNEEDLKRCFANAQGVDLIVTSGGASVGEHDLVQKVAGDLGMKLDFWKVAMRPGKPLIFGDMDGTPLLGLPGNPVSACVCAIIYLRGIIQKMAGLPTELPSQTLPLAQNLGQSGPREDFMRARLQRDNDGQMRAYPVSKQDSSMFRTLAEAEILIRRQKDDIPRDENDPVNIIDLRQALQLTN